MRFFGSCSRKIDSHLARARRTPSGTRLFARERENVAQEGFDALVHLAPPVSLADSPSPPKAPALTQPRPLMRCVVSCWKGRPTTDALVDPPRAMRIIPAEDWSVELFRDSALSSRSFVTLDCEYLHRRQAPAQRCSAQGLHAKMGAGVYPAEEIG